MENFCDLPLREMAKVAVLRRPRQTNVSDLFVLGSHYHPYVRQQALNGYPLFEITFKSVE